MRLLHTMLRVGDLQRSIEFYTNVPGSYTHDAADDLLCVALGGRRIIKKKTPHEEGKSHSCSDTQRQGREAVFSTDRQLH